MANKILIRSLHIAFILFLLISPAAAQFFESPEDELIRTDTLETKPRYGIYGNFNLNLHASNFNKLPGVPSCCPSFEGGFGTGYSFGGLFDYALDHEKFINIRAGYAVFNGSFEEEEPTTVLIDGVHQPGAFKHTLDAELSTVGIEPMFGHRIWRRMFGHAGFRFGYVIDKNYDQIERVSKPAKQGTFLDGQRFRNDLDGEIEEAASVQFAVNLGASYELPLKEDYSLLLAPEIFYTFWLTPVVSNTKWSVHTIRAGLSLKYKEPPPPPPPPPPPLPAPMPDDSELPLPPEPPALAASVKAVKIDSNNNVQRDFNVRIEDFISLNMRPLLNYIFFDSASAEIPSRYNKLKPYETDQFDFKTLHNLNALETYYHIMNIAGKRLKTNPQAAVTLIGTNSGQGAEKNNPDLSRARANAVKDYLVIVWGIKDDRIEVRARNLPEEPSRSDEEGADAENRRVEIISENWNIKEPILTVDTMRVISTTTIRFLPNVKTGAGIDSWNLNMKQGDRTLKMFNGSVQPPEELEWKLKQDSPQAPQKAGDITYQLTVKDTLGQIAQSNKQYLPVEKLTIDKKRLQRIEDKEFEYYSLILFDYGSSRLGREHREVLDFVKDRITEDAEVIIFGHTDKLGKEEVNERLSKRRANSAARMLRIPDAQVKGVGESELLYDNSLPEGRFYCRTVRIEIITPVKNHQDKNNNLRNNGKELEID